MTRPNSGEMHDNTPSTITAIHGVRYLGCRRENARGRTPDSANANIRRLPQMMNAFQLVRMPPTPPAISAAPAHGPPQSAVAASAVATVEAARASASSARATPKEMAPYQATAMTRETISSHPIRFAGRSISSADCGRTSKPTMSAGTMMSTVRIPVAGISTRG